MRIVCVWRGVEAYEQFHLLCALPFTMLLEFSSCELYNQGKKRLFKKQNNDNNSSNDTAISLKIVIISIFILFTMVRISQTALV